MEKGERKEDIREGQKAIQEIAIVLLLQSEDIMRNSAKNNTNNQNLSYYDNQSVLMLLRNATLFVIDAKFNFINK